MTLQEFAHEAGMELVILDKQEAQLWGGKYGYKTADSPNFSIVGIRTEKSAYRSWEKGTFGNKAAKALFKLLENKE